MNLKTGEYHQQQRPLKKSDFPENENPIKTHSQKRVNFS